MANSIQVAEPIFFYPPKLLHAHYGRFLQWSVERTLDELREQFHPEVVLSYWTHPDGEVAVRFARRLGIPAVTMVGGSDVLLLTSDRRRRECVVRVLEQADAVVAVSQNVARRVCELGIPPRKVHVIHRGIDGHVFCPGEQAAARRRLGVANDAKLLVAAGRLVPVKGFPVLIDALRLLTGGGTPIACYVLGKGPCRGELERQVERNGLCGVVRFAGPQGHVELADWYRAADAVVLPSLSEGIPNVLLEAMACGTPFVASDVGGVAEIADPVHDRLVPAGDAEALATAIAERLATPQADSPRRFLPQSWDESADRVSAILAACQSGNGNAIDCDEWKRDFALETCNSEKRSSEVSVEHEYCTADN
jgi:glycosyltransferase involved in cell wall biosynthesis